MAKELTTVLNAPGRRTRSTEEEFEILLSMTGCVVLDCEAVYASSEFTSGRRFYNLCRENGVRTKEELKARLGSAYNTQLLNPNLDEGKRFARRLCTEMGHRIILVPNVLFVKDWTQPEYLAFWERVILHKCRAVYFNEGWEFSNGCTFEYLVGMKAGLPLWDSTGRTVSVDRARELIGGAISQLRKDGFECPELERVYEELSST